MNVDTDYIETRELIYKGERLLWKTELG